MLKVLKNIGFFLATIIITAAIFWLVFINKESKQDVLDYSLGLLGEKLMAMVPEGEEKKPVKDLYENFLAQAKQKEVPPEKIENVAASILNLSNMDTVVTAKEAEAILKLSLAEPIKIEQAAADTFTTRSIKRKPRFIAVAPPPPKPPKKRSPEEWTIVGERIKSAYEFNSEYQQAMRNYYRKLHDPHLRMKFHVEDGLKISIDENLKPEFDRRKFKRLQEKMKKMEKERIIVWQKNFSEEMREEQERLKHELESLKKLKELEKLGEVPGLEALESLQALKSLEALQHILVVNADSIRIIVEKSLEKAGACDQDKK